MPLPPGSEAPGIVAHEYSDAFLHCFGRLVVRHHLAFGTGSALMGVRLGFDERIRRLSLADRAVFVQELVGRMPGFEARRLAREE